jgi:Holliday junction resolvasome RuvABC ATP-dependent DNA helicase subunit
VQRAKQIDLYCETKNCREFSSKDWADLCEKVGINASGLVNAEIQVLKTLKERGECSLNMLSAVTGLSRGALQRDTELFLLQRGFMRIEGNRKITAAGIKALEEATAKK